jgi:3-oxoacyl-[acyl-carrier-protein] synthase-3
LQYTLKLSEKCFCIDLPHGCTGYIYGLSIAHSLIQSKIAKNILLLTADTPSYTIHKNDLELLSIFGDSATATFITNSNTSTPFEKFVFYTDGSGYDKLIVERSGQVNPPDFLYLQQYPNLPYGIMKMDGTAIFLMSIKRVPNLIYETLEKNNLRIEDIDYFIFHQANSFMLEVLRKKLKILKINFLMIFAIQEIPCLQASLLLCNN